MRLRRSRHRGLCRREIRGVYRVPGGHSRREPHPGTSPRTTPPGWRSELGQESVAGVLDDSRIVSCQSRLHDCAAHCCATRVCAGLVAGHVPCVVDHVDGDDRRQPVGRLEPAAARAADQPQVRLICPGCWFPRRIFCWFLGEWALHGNAHDTSLWREMTWTELTVKRAPSDDPRGPYVPDLAVSRQLYRLLLDTAANGRSSARMRLEREEVAYVACAPPTRHSRSGKANILCVEMRFTNCPLWPLIVAICRA